MAKRTESQLVQDIAIPQALLAWKNNINIRMAKLAEKYPDNERLMWPQLTVEATAHLADTSVHTPMLTATAVESGVPITDLANTVLTNAAALSAATGYLSGLRIKGDLMLKSCTSISQLEGVRIELGV